MVQAPLVQWPEEKGEEVGEAAEALAAHVGALPTLGYTRGFPSDCKASPATVTQSDGRGRRWPENRGAAEALGAVVRLLLLTHAWVVYGAPARAPADSFIRAAAKRFVMRTMARGATVKAPQR